MQKAFLSHSSKQKTIVELIANKLGRENCVLDKYNFEIGSPTLEEIIKGINQSDLFVLFLSDEALDSDWVQNEIRLVKNLSETKQLLVVLVDDSITHNDTRIPPWLVKIYNIQPLLDPILLYKKIDSKLRDISIANHPFIKQKEEIFIGRAGLMDEFEKKYYTIDLIKPTAIIASGFEGVGRRKVLKHSLDKIGRLNKFHEPISITLDSRSSVEDFIIGIEDLNSKNTEDVISTIKDETLENKIIYAKNLLSQFQRSNEILFILDKGCVVQPNKNIANWFEKIISSEEFANNTCVCVISIFRPFYASINNNHKIIALHVNELSPSDRQVLFIKYCDLFEIQPEVENINKILGILNGMPDQIFYAVDLVREYGSEYVVGQLDMIKKHEDVKVFQVIDMIKREGNLFYNLLIFISKFEFISYNFVYKIFTKSDELNEALDKLFVFGVYDRIGVDKEYIKVHHAISDYISRAKYDIEPKIKQMLKKEVESLLTQHTDYPDLSSILVTIKTLIQAGKKIPDKYFIPSVALRTIYELNYLKKYDQVNDLAERVLSNYRKYDDGIVREVRYWHTQAFARRKLEDFYTHVKYFDGLDYQFLMGFQRRMQKKFSEAEQFFRRALEIDPNSQKSGRELVNVLLPQRKYSEAIEWARKNYEKGSGKLNSFHIQGYFICLIRRPNLSAEEILIINELMANIKISHDFKANEISLTMEGEFEFYIKNNFPQAVEKLKTAIRECEHKFYPMKALAEIYHKRGMHAEEDKYLKIINETNEPALD